MWKVIICISFLGNFLNSCSRIVYDEYLTVVKTENFTIKITEINDVIGKRVVVINNKTISIFAGLTLGKYKMVYKKKLTNNQFEPIYESSKEILRKNSGLSRYGEERIGLDVLDVEIINPDENSKVFIITRFCKVKELEGLFSSVNNVLPKKFKVERYLLI